MVLAFQCGEWDLDSFGEQLPKETMDRWEQWFSLRPQGQYHRDRFQAFQSSLICASNGAEIEPSAFMYYEKTEEEELTVDEQWDRVAHLIPQSPSLKNEVKPNVESREHGDEPDCGCEPAHSGNQHCQGEQSGLVRLD